MRPIIYGILAAMFFAVTFILNQSMQGAGGHWIYSASLRFFLMLPFFVVIVMMRRGDRARLPGASSRYRLLVTVWNDRLRTVLRQHLSRCRSCPGLADCRNVAIDDFSRTAPCPLVQQTDSVVSTEVFSPDRPRCRRHATIGRGKPIATVAVVRSLTGPRRGNCLSTREPEDDGTLWERARCV